MTDFINLKARAEADFGRLARRAADQGDELRAVRACVGLALRSACHFHDKAGNILAESASIGGHTNMKDLYEWARMFPTSTASVGELVKRSRSCASLLLGGVSEQRVNTVLLFAFAGLKPEVLPPFYKKWLFGDVYNELATFRAMVNHIGPCLFRLWKEMRKRLTNKGFSKLGTGWRFIVEQGNDEWVQLVKEFFVPISPAREEEILSIVTPRERAPRRATMALPGTQQAHLYVPASEVRTLIGPVGAPVVITPVGRHTRVEVDLVTRSKHGSRFYFSSPVAVIPVSELCGSVSSATVQQHLSGSRACEEGAVAVLLGDGTEPPTGRPEHMHPEPEPQRAIMSAHIDEIYRRLAQGETELWQAAHAQVKERRVATMKKVKDLREVVGLPDNSEPGHRNTFMPHHELRPTYLHPVSYDTAGRDTDGTWPRRVNGGTQRSGTSSEAGAAVVVPGRSTSTQRRLEAAARALSEHRDAIHTRQQQQVEGGEASSLTSSTAPSLPLSPALLPSLNGRHESRESPDLFRMLHAVAAAHEDRSNSGGGSLESEGRGSQRTSEWIHAPGAGTPEALISSPPSPLLRASPTPSAFLFPSGDIAPDDFLLPHGVPCVKGSHTKGRGTFPKCVGPDSPFTKVGACAECLVAALENAESNGGAFEAGLMALVDEEHIELEDAEIYKSEMNAREAKRAVSAVQRVLLTQEELSVKLQLLAEAKAPPTVHLARALDLQVEIIRALTCYASDAAQGNEVIDHPLLPRGLYEREGTFNKRLKALFENDGRSRHPFNEEGTGGQLKCVQEGSASCEMYAGTTREPVVLTHSPPSSPTESPSDSSDFDDATEPEPKRRRLERV